MEIWKDIKGYEGLYQVSNLGNVKTLSRIYYAGAKHSQKRVIKEKLLAQFTDKDGYKTVNLKINGTRKMFKVHRLVATMFLDNINNYSVVNHKNEIKEDNRVENLEWCSVKYNNSYGTKLKRTKEKNSKPVFGIDCKTGYIITFSSSSEAFRAGFSDIWASLKYDHRKTKGYKFYYGYEKDVKVVL